MQALCDRVTDWHAAAGQGQNDDVRPIRVRAQPVGETCTRSRSIWKRQRHVDQARFAVRGGR